MAAPDFNSLPRGGQGGEDSERRIEALFENLAARIVEAIRGAGGGAGGDGRAGAGATGDVARTAGGSGASSTNKLFSPHAARRIAAAATGPINALSPGALQTNAAAAEGLVGVAKAATVLGATAAGDALGGAAAGRAAGTLAEAATDAIDKLSGHYGFRQALGRAENDFGGIVGGYSAAGIKLSDRDLEAGARVEVAKEQRRQQGIERAQRVVNEVGYGSGSSLSFGLARNGW